MTLINESSAGRFHTWSPWGNAHPADALPGFNGERPDPVSGTYHLGNGYRAYNPVLMRFNCPDSLSPFGAGGINPYAYCAGDPVNHTDPSGHISPQGIIGIIAGIFGLGLSIFTAGASVMAAGSVAAAVSSASTTALVVGGLGVMADVTGIVSGAMEDVNPEASSVLGWVSLATGLAGMASGAALAPKGIRAVKTIRENNMRASGISSHARSSLHSNPSLSRSWSETYENMDFHFSSDETFARYQSRPSASSFSSRASTTSSYERRWEDMNTPKPLFLDRRVSEISVSGYENINSLSTAEINERILKYSDNLNRIFPNRMTNSEYRHLARRLHPDTSGYADTEEAFKILNNWFNA